jgi:hypothetical protein
MSLPDTPGLRLLSSGGAFLRAAKLLHESDPKSLTWAPYYVNIGLAIELGLKGFLREKGVSETQQIAIGHNLEKAFYEAVRLGFMPKHPAQERFVKELNPHYKDMSLRYQVGDSVVLPELRDAIAITDSLIGALLLQCAAKYRRI